MKPFLILALVISLSLSRLESNAQVCTISCPNNLIVMADSSKEGAIVHFPKATTTGECGAITYTPASGSFLRLGSHSVVVSTASGQKCSFTVTVTDNESPQISGITLSSKTLWPATNKKKRVAVYYEVKDNGEEVSTSLSVDSNDPGNKDWEVINPHLVVLKASRLPNGEPKIYFITVSAKDISGNITRKTTSIAVSKTMEAIPLARQ
jgi:hypothetical protein